MPDPSITSTKQTASHASTGHRRHIHAGHGHGPHNRKEIAALSLGALGVVYGDIGTSPLYAMNECLSASKEHAVHPSLHGMYEPAQIYGVLSLFFWAMMLVVVLKYLVFIMRADNKGEGGILALAALVQQSDKTPRRTKLAIPILLALFGAGLLYGDGVITPAVSVLGAVEGISEQNPAFAELVVPISAVILIGLFWVQKLGTHRIGTIFGWVMLLWFFAIGCAGLPFILRHPEVLKAVSPHYAFEFMAHFGMRGYLILGSVVLCITGGEALYADMGHFGRTPIRVAWTTVVFPGLLLNYFGQGALFLERGQDVSNGFYDLVSHTRFLIPMVVLATLAAVIASQALISGGFSLTNQAVQLGYLTRVSVVHTSHKNEGQIYVPEVNWALMIACVALVFAFRSSSNLAAAYGIAVTG
ncbi:MAG TPA: KUP/HAK/KT family potassium transporter, partial [Kofleriaceae bacterium]